MTEYLRPSSLSEATKLRGAHPTYMVLAGGTDLLVDGAKKPEPPGILDLFGLEDIRGISRGSDGTISLGAGVTYRELLASPVVRDELPMLWACAREVGALQIQARGTIGGNLATSSPVGDTLPVFLALSATVRLASPGGEREIPYESFCTGYRQTALAADELIAGVSIPPRPDGTRQFWRKVGPRRAQSISKVMLAASARLEHGKLSGVHLALGAVADRPVRVAETEAALTGQSPGKELERIVRESLAQEISPIDDVRSTARYRLRTAQNLVCQFLRVVA